MFLSLKRKKLRLLQEATEWNNFLAKLIKISNIFTWIISKKTNERLIHQMSRSFPKILWPNSDIIPFAINWRLEISFSMRSIFFEFYRKILQRYTFIVPSNIFYDARIFSRYFYTSGQCPLAIGTRIKVYIDINKTVTFFCV